MPWLEKVLAAVDMSSRTRPVLEYAAFLTELYGADLQVIHVLLERPGDGWATASSQAERLDAESDFFRLVYRGHELRKILNGLPYQAARRAKLDVEVGDPAEVIANKLASGRHDLVLVGRPIRRRPGGLEATIRDWGRCGVMVVSDDVRIPFSPRQEGASGPVMQPSPNRLGMAPAPWKYLDAIEVSASYR
jgi:hypothetical protein